MRQLNDNSIIDCHFVLLYIIMKWDLLKKHSKELSTAILIWLKIFGPHYGSTGIRMAQETMPGVGSINYI